MDHDGKPICRVDHAGEVPQEVLDSLPKTQRLAFRHLCPACAYAAGMNEAAEDVRQLVEEIKQLREENERLKAAPSTDSSSVV